MNILKSALLAVSLVLAPQVIANEIESLELSQGLEERLNRDIAAYLGNDNFILSIRAEVLTAPLAQGENGYNEPRQQSGSKPNQAVNPSQNGPVPANSASNTEDDFDLPALPSRSSSEEQAVDPAIAQAKAQISAMEQTINQQAELLETQAAQANQLANNSSSEKN